MSAVIEVTGLVKRYGSTTALDGLELAVEAGEVHGFLGPNGAGKSTTIRILLGLLRADAGRARVLGADPWHEAVAVHRRLAYVPGDVALWPNLTGGEVIDVLTRLRGGGDAARSRELCERFDLDPTKRCRTYSKGNRQKVALVAALASDAELLLLDEPTAGLDPLMEAEFQLVVGQVKAQGRTVLLSSHILGQVEQLADRVTIIRRGVRIEHGSLDELRHLTRSQVTVRTERVVDHLDAVEGVHDLTRHGDGAVSFGVDAPRLDEVLGLLHQHGVRSLECRPPTLEQLFLHRYGEDLTALEAR